MSVLELNYLVAGAIFIISINITSGFSGWSLSLLSLYGLLSYLTHIDFSAYYILVVSLVILNVALCIALSPLQVLLPINERTEPDEYKSKVFKACAEESKATVDIIVVHGLGSNPKTAWNGSKGRPGENQSWLRDFLPKEKLQARVIFFNYYSKWNSHAIDKSLKDYGNDLIRAIVRERAKEDSKRPLVFIGHSFGGIVVKQAIVNAAERAEYDFIRKQTRGFFFIGTPHKGSRLTALGKLIAPFGYWAGSSIKLLTTLELGSTILQNLHESFVAFIISERRLIERTVCIYETFPKKIWKFPIAKIVEGDSASIDGAKNWSSAKDHNNLQRISTSEDEIYRDIIGAIKEWVGVLQVKQKVSKNKRTKIEQGYLTSLEFERLHTRELDIKEGLEETCTWLEHHEQYTSWLKPNASIKLLWFHGKPGSGKSTLMKYMVQQSKSQGLASASSEKNTITMSFFFSGTGDKMQKSSLGMYQTLVYQLLDQNPEALTEFAMTFQKYSRSVIKEQHSWHESDLKTFFQSSLLKLRKDYIARIFIDAIDETDEETMQELVSDFEKLIEKAEISSSSSSGSLHVCISKRHFPAVLTRTKEYINVEVGNQKDIATYVKSKIRDLKFERDQINQMEKLVVERAKGVFLWAVLVLRKVSKLCTNGKSFNFVMKAIGKVPTELKDLYQEIIGAIDEEDRDRALHMLQWLLFARYPLSVAELQIAMSLDRDQTNLVNFSDYKSLPSYIENDSQMHRLVASLSGGLAEVMSSSGDVLFIHQTVRDVLLDGGLQVLRQQSEVSTSTLAPKYSLEGESHFHISRDCIKYFSLKEIKLVHEKIRSGQIAKTYIPVRHPFLCYAIDNWVWHCQMAEKHGAQQEDLLDLFDWTSKEPSDMWKTCAIINSEAAQIVGVSDYPSILLVASAYGLKSVVVAALEHEDLSSRLTLDGLGREVYIYAFMNGHMDIVEHFLFHANHYHCSAECVRTGNTVLIYAAARTNRKNMICKIIESGVIELDTRDNYGRTAFMYATAVGNVDVMNRLINTGRVDIEFKDSRQRTPLFYPVLNNKCTAVKLLLDSGKVDINGKDHRGCTCLYYIKDKNDFEEMRFLLLQYGGRRENYDDQNSDMIEDTFREVAIASKFDTQNFTRFRDRYLVWDRYQNNYLRESNWKLYTWIRQQKEKKKIGRRIDDDIALFVSKRK